MNLYKCNQISKFAMEDEKFSVQNDNELDIKGVIQRPKKTGKFVTVVLAPDILETSEDAHIKELTRLFLEKGFAVVRFEFTNSFGKSAGRVENLTVSQRARDLELVVQHVKRRSYVGDRIVIIGFGFGAMASLVLEGFQNLARAIVLVNCPSAIDDTAWTSFSERDMTRVRLKRYFHIIREGQEIRINYSFYEDGYRLDMFRCARNLRTPALYLHSKENPIVKPVHSERLYERTNGKKEMEHIVGLEHSISKKSAQTIFDKSVAFFKKQKVS
jgi:predicted alpha/beta-fold hydrolase